MDRPRIKEKLDFKRNKLAWVVGGFIALSGVAFGIARLEPGAPSVAREQLYLDEVKEGTLVIHVVDPARNAEVWRGSVSRELKEGTVDQGAVNAAVVDAFSDFPRRSAQP